MAEFEMDRTKRHQGKYPFPRMQAGDHFFLPSIYASLVSVAAANFGRRNGGKYSVRKVAADKHVCERMV